jgi:hypothetical protein
MIRHRRLFFTPFLALFALGALTLMGGVSPALAEVVFPPGQRIGLEPPPGMTLDKVTRRFEDRDHNASITILDLPLQLYSEMEKLVLTETAKPGVTVTSRESFPYESGIGYYVAVRLVVDGKAYRKWILLASSAAAPISDLAALVSIQIPEEASNIYPDSVMRAALKSVTFRPTPVDERLALLPFSMSDLSGFKVTQVAPTGVVLNDPSAPNALPRIFISIGQGSPEAADDRARFARDMIRNLPVNNLETVSEEPMRIRGTPGFEIQARAKDPTGADIRLVQWVRFGSGGYLTIVAGATKDDWEKSYPRFRAVRDGIDLR